MEAKGTPDWRDAAAYAPLLSADRSLFAWEWLRRDPCYMAAAAAASERFPKVAPAAAAFGLVDFEPPERTVPHARPLWNSHVHPFVLRVAVVGDAAPDDPFDLRRFADFAKLVADEANDHLLLSDGLRAIRMDAPGGTFAGRPLGLCYMLHGIAAAERPLLSLRRLLALCRRGTFSSALHRPEPRARRWILMLRAHDALAADADQREIARELFSRTAGEPRWRSRESSVRSQAQRLVRSARRFSSGGHRLLLL